MFILILMLMVYLIMKGNFKGNLNTLYSILALFYFILFFPRDDRGINTTKIFLFKNNYLFLGGDLKKFG